MPLILRLVAPRPAFAIDEAAAVFRAFAEALELAPIRPSDRRSREGSVRPSVEGSLP